MKTTRLLVAVAALTAITAMPASADHGGIHPSFASRSVYFSCPGPTKLHQTNQFFGAGEGASWDASPPAQSIQEGGGCGGGDVAPFGGPMYDVVFRGTFTGNLRDVTVRLHEALGSALRGTETEILRLGGDIDGVPIFPAGWGNFHGRTFTVAPSSPGQAITRYEFSITNLGFAREILDEEGKVVDVETGGVALEDGDGTGEHMLTLFVSLHSSVGAVNTGQLTTWAWGATEVPGGITFNPPGLAPATVAADLPAFEE